MFTLFQPNPQNLPASNPANFQVTYAAEGDSIFGSMNVPAPRGALVTKTTNADGTEGFALANGTRGVHLERDVINNVSGGVGGPPAAGGTGGVPFIAFSFMQDFVIPEVTGSTVTARRARFTEVEGIDLVLTSGLGAISSATPVNTELSTSNGSYAVRQAGQELQGWIRGFKAPQGDGTFRLVIEHAGA